MDPPSNVPRSGEDLSRAFRNLPPGTLSGLDALCDHSYWMSVMRQSEIEISNEDIFRFRFSEISKTASNRLAFLAGSGEYSSFNLRYLIQQLVEQCTDMHKYTRKLEKYVVKLQRRVEEVEANQQKERTPAGGSGRLQDGDQRLPPPQPLQHGGSGTNGTGGGGGGGWFSGRTSSSSRATGSSAGAYHLPLPCPYPPANLVDLLGPKGQPAQLMGPGKRPRSPFPPGSMEAAGSTIAAEQDDE